MLRGKFIVPELRGSSADKAEREKRDGGKKIEQEGQKCAKWRLMRKHKFVSSYFMPTHSATTAAAAAKKRKILTRSRTKTQNKTNDMRIEEGFRRVRQ